MKTFSDVGAPPFIEPDNHYLLRIVLHLNETYLLLGPVDIQDSHFA